MSQKFIKVKNNNGDSHAFGKYYATAAASRAAVQQVVRQQVAARPRATIPVILTPTATRTRMSSLN